MLGIRRETDYAVRTILHLASVGERANVQVREVAAQRRLPLSFVRRIVARLGAAGLLETTRGMGGGIRLARPAAEISMLDVVRAMEGRLALNPCVVAPHTCPLAAGCPAQRAWADATAALEIHLAAVRFDELARGARGHVSAHKRLRTPSAGPTKPPRTPRKSKPVVRRKGVSG